MAKKGSATKPSKRRNRLGSQRAVTKEEPARNGNPQQPNAANSQDQTNKSIRTATWVIAGAAIVALIVSCLQWRATQDAVVAANRAWLSVEEVRLEGLSKFDEEGMRFVIALTIKNVGDSPATNVSAEVDTYFVKDASFVRAQQAFADGLRKRAEFPTGTALFKDDTRLQRISWPVPKDRFDKKIREMPNGRRVIDFQIFVGVGYRVSGDPKGHITVRTFDMLNTPLGAELKNGDSRRLSESPLTPPSLTKITPPSQWCFADMALTPA